MSHATAEIFPEAAALVRSGSVGGGVVAGFPFTIGKKLRFLGWFYVLCPCRLDGVYG